MFWSWNVEDDDGGGGDDIVSNEKLLKQFDVGEAIRSRPLWKDGDFGIDWLKLLFTFSEPEEDDEDPAVWSVVLLPFATIALSLIITIFRVQVENFSIFILKIELNRKKSRKSIHIESLPFPSFLSFLFFYLFLYILCPVEWLLMYCCYHCELYLLTDDELICLRLECYDFSNTLAKTRTFQSFLASSFRQTLEKRGLVWVEKSIGYCHFPCN